MSLKVTIIIKEDDDDFAPFYTSAVVSDAEAIPEAVRLMTELWVKG
jgi:hypothetical protein